MRNKSVIGGAVLFALLYALAACSMQPQPGEGPAAKLYRSYGVPLEMAAQVHEDIRIAGRRAEEAGLLAGEDLEKAKTAINSSATAINAAKTTLRLLQEGGIMTTDLTNLDNAHQAIRALIKLSVELGFWEEE